MSGKVILYQGVYQYEAVNVFIEELAAGFARLGREAVFIDLADRGSVKERLQQELSGPLECVVSFGAVGCEIALGGKPLYDHLPAPFVAVLVDHPAHHLERFAMENIIITSYDRSHLAFLRRYFEGKKRLGFLPHGGSAAEGSAAEDRPVDVLFAGTYTPPEDAYARLRALSGADFPIMDAVVERLMATDCEPMEDMLGAVLTERGRDGEWRRLCARLAEVDIFMKAFKRLEILKALDAAGIAVDIVGAKWPAGLFKNHRIRPAVPYREALRMMRVSKIVLNMGFVPDGSHERVFSAMRNGAAVVGDFNPYLDELFRNGEEILLFRWTEMENLPDMIAGLLGDEAKRRACVSGAGAKTGAHTWAARAASLLDIVGRSRRDAC